MSKTDKIAAESAVGWFRAASPYITGHRGKTFVVYIPGHVIARDNLSDIAQDIVLVSSLGIHLVIVHGAAPQIEQALDLAGKTSEFNLGIRVTTPDILPLVEFGVGQARSRLESELNKADVRLSSGNHIKAKPLGVEAGIDFHNTGRVRRVNSKAIRQQLESGAIVILSSIGHSPSGETFNINSAEVAGEVASSMISDKLIIIDQDVRDNEQALVNEIRAADIDTTLLGEYDPLTIARQASMQGVDRCHLLDSTVDGVLLAELFTRDGAGTQVIRKSYEQVRVANSDDVGGIIELIEPLEAQGILVKRPRELLESEIGQFIVIDRDGSIVGCAAIYAYGNDAELACLVTHPNYRDGTRGEILLKTITTKAKDLGCRQLFVLTTHTDHWFKEHGFVETSLETLPVERQELYNYQRNSKLLMTTI